MGAIWITWVGIGRCWWVWSGYEYKLEGNVGLYYTPTVCPIIVYMSNSIKFFVHNHSHVYVYFKCVITQDKATPAPPPPKMEMVSIDNMFNFLATEINKCTWNSFGSKILWQLLLRYIMEDISWNASTHTLEKCCGCVGLTYPQLKFVQQHSKTCASCRWLWRKQLMRFNPIWNDYSIPNV